MDCKIQSFWALIGFSTFGLPSSARDGNDSRARHRKPPARDDPPGDALLPADENPGEDQHEKNRQTRDRNDGDNVAHLDGRDETDAGDEVQAPPPGKP